MKLKIYKTFFVFLIIIALIIIGLLAVKYGRNYKNEIETKKVAETFAREIANRRKQ